jgi:hypothetical protein
MYPVITRAYEVGSQDDTASTGSSNLLIGVGAGALAVGVLAVGLSALSQNGKPRPLPNGIHKKAMEP